MNAELSDQAAMFLDRLYDYYFAEGGTRLADRMLAEIFDEIQKVIDRPSLGKFREDLTDKPLRFHRVRNHFLIYDAASSPLHIARIYHAKQDIKTRMTQSD